MSDQPPRPATGDTPAVQDRLSRWLVGDLGALADLVSEVDDVVFDDPAVAEVARRLREALGTALAAAEQRRHTEDGT